ncbi:hypothetical protein [Streptomyces sp. NRRL S-337]|uniref:hypothetical protein n=1 Tax=Streptomyces sp. NRRL S-337 TaxID=1463900 RepID=UPI00131DAF56|nr:hypothetical protein [Streptomyces sp. NRRL S-337]
MFNRRTATSEPSAQPTPRIDEPVRETGAGEFKPPRHWLPDPISRLGATFYAIAGAALWETTIYVVHHVHVVITWI